MLPKKFSSELYHYGVLGMKWGVRRYQNTDGTLTAAGKRRIANSIKKEYPKDTTNNGYVRLVKGISDELSVNYKTQLSSHIRNIQDKKLFMDKVSDVDSAYYNSKEYKQARQRSYDETYRQFEKDDPELLQQLIDKNDGDKTTLRRFHDFDTLCDGFTDSIVNESHNRYYEKRGLDPSAAFNAHSDYRKACNDAAKDVVGVYGMLKVPKEYSWMNDTTVNQIVSAAMRNLADEEAVNTKAINDRISKLPKSDRKQVSDIVSKFETDKWDDRISNTKTKIGDVDIDFNVRSSKGREVDSAAEATNFLKKYDLSKAKEGVAKEYYDGEHSWIDKDPSGDNYYTRNDFKNKIKPVTIDVDPENRMYMVVWSDGGTYGGHVFVDEGSIDDMKVRNRSLEG